MLLRSLRSISLLAVAASALSSCGDSQSLNSELADNRTPTRPMPIPAPIPGRPLPVPSILNPETTNLSAALPIEKGTLRFGKKLKTINFQRLNTNTALVEGDILIPLRSVLAPRNNVLEESPADPNGPDVYNRWPGGIVHYRIDPSLTNQQRVTDAIAHWEAKTSLRFELRNSLQTDYITFRPGSGCSSYIGMTDGEQFVNLADGCSTGNAIHEIGHAIGFWHEHTRFDRDTFINVNWDNIQAGLEHNFRDKSDAGFSGEDVGTYDFSSIMHYGSSFFSKNGQPTITKKDGTLITAQRNGLSAGDLTQAEALYNGYIRGDCVGFNSSNLTLRVMNGKYLIVDGNHSMFAFDVQAEAQQALNILRSFNGTQSCFVGRPGPSMNYFLTTGGQAPTGWIAGEDCISFDPATVRVEDVNNAGNHYRVVSGNMWMLDFGDKRFEAGRALRVIRDMGFTKQCFVGRPGPSFTYWKK
ncbi:MAG: hypothetical protein RIR26_1394 [Pseudomonadota bacterium]|jgi:hypothetical protein